MIKLKQKIETHFRRVLYQIMKIALTDDEINALADKYGSTQRNSLNNINYKQFCNTINRCIFFNNLNKEGKFKQKAFS